MWSSVAVAYANLLLSSTSLPTASDFAGSLLTAGAHGTSNLTFTAADSGPGIYKATVTVDGAVVYTGTPNTNGGKCAPVGTDAGSGALMWDWQQPCPQSQTVVVPVDTTVLRDGEHQLKVTLQSAAGNVSTVLSSALLDSWEEFVVWAANCPAHERDSARRCGGGWLGGGQGALGGLRL